MKIYTCRVAIKLEAISEKEAFDKVKKYCEIVNSHSEKDSSIKMKFIFLPEEGIDIDSKEAVYDKNKFNRWLN